MHTCERDFKMSSSATVMSSVSGGSPDPPGGMGHRARHQRRGAGLEAYSCLCGSFILVLVTLLVVFVVGIIRSRQVTDQIDRYLYQYQAREGEGLAATKTAIYRRLFVNNYLRIFAFGHGDRYIFSLIFLKSMMGRVWGHVYIYIYDYITISA